MPIVRHRFRDLAGGCAVATALAGTGFAQTTTVIDAGRFERTSASVTVEAGSFYVGSTAIPFNLIVPDFRPLVAGMLRDSTTFRRQCQRLENEPTLIVRLRRALHPLPPHSRAQTRIVRAPSGTLAADIEVPALDDHVELIALEIEHVVEQLDNIDLAAAAARPGTGVRLLSTAPLIFETTRAMRVGRLVAEEVRRAAR